MGGTASSCDSAPGQFTLTDLKDLPIGQTKEMSSGCGPDIGGTQVGSCYDQLRGKGFGWPNNGEFGWGGTGNSCSLCSFNYGCECAGGVGGKRGTVTRTNFNGNPTKCCTSPSNKWWDGTGATPLDTDKTCHPDSKDYAKTYCDQYMATYCATDNNAGNTQCSKWAVAAVNRGSEIANNIMSNYCSQGTNYGTPACQTWVKATLGKPSLKYAGDSALSAYCQNNSTDPKCACQNPPQNVTSLQKILTTPKVCWYEPCKTDSTQYLSAKDQDILTGSACAGVTCQINAGDVSVADSSQTKTNIVNKCGTQLDTSALNSPPSGGSGSPPSGGSGSPPSGGSGSPTGSGGSDDSDDLDKPSGSNTPAEAESNNKMLLFGGGGIISSSSLCMCCIIIIVIVFVMMQKKKSD